MSHALDPRAEIAAHWDTWRAWALANGVAIAAETRLREAFFKVTEASDYVTQALHREPALLARLLENGELEAPYPQGGLADRLDGMLAPVEDEAALAATLRRFRRAQMVRIIWRDLAGWATLAEILATLSALADACIELALGRLFAWSVRDFGTPRDAAGTPQGLVVIGMGKLGACELNLSSDIDLIFAFPRPGQTDGARRLSNEQFFFRLAQRLIQVLGAQTADGFVFRVDTRLRPFGDAGPLAMSFDAMEDYYQSQARAWERYAMIKARVVAGDQEAGERLMAVLRPFVYRRYLDYGVVESLREMKRLIVQELKRKGMEDNIKLGPGGIREIEFIGQALQLIRGGRDPELQLRPILLVLDRLQTKRLLSTEAVQELCEAYVFLRRLENRLQAWRDQQTHQLPQAEDRRWRLARAMGFADWAGFEPVLAGHRQRVQYHFDQIFGEPESEDQGGAALSAIWETERAGDHALVLLQEVGFRDPPGTLELLGQFRQAVDRRGLGTRGRERLAQLMPRLLQAVAARPAPDEVLPRLLKILEAIARRTAYIELLLENPVALTQLVRLVGMSSWVSAQIERHPLLLDELLDPRRLYSPLSHSDLERELKALLSAVDEDDLEQQMDRLRQFSQSNMLRVAAADLTGAIPLMVVSDYLTDIAEVTLGAVLNLAWQHLTARYGRPSHEAGDGQGFVVIGYGKLGGIELGYGSDLDLVFLHGGERVSALTSGPQPLASDVFFARLGQRMIHLLTTQTAAGVLYPVDMRLRPDGAKGLLVRSLRSFADYQAKDAWTWEHQALVRARPVAGDPEMARRFERVRRDTLARPRNAETLREEVRAMRERMREQSDKTRPGQFDLKQGAGGIADIEFMVQYFTLRWASEYPDLVKWPDNIRLLETLSRNHLLPAPAAARLADAYRALRAAYHRCTLRDAPTLVADDVLLAERTAVRSLWDQWMGDGERS